jgi:catechol 2,3-dioxygenase-like lactoylglutathione lyase family enzyme
MAAQAATKYDVGGVLLDRPFKIRRLGHFGLNVREVEPMAHFYLDLLGFRRSDASGGGGFFSRYGSDHHALVIFEKEVADKQLLASPTGPAHFRPENTINQLTFQVQSRREVVDATQYFHDRGVDVNREGRAGGPGSNWHLYAYDPDDQIVELYYGIEQIGWDGYSKPVDMRPGGQKEAYPAPHMPEYQEVDQALARGGNATTGYRHVEALPATYDVDGILLPRPFKVTKVGPVKLFVDDLAAAERFYRDVLGFVLTEEVAWEGERCLFLRCDTEHHTLGLFPEACQAKLGLSPHTSAMSFGMQVANYRQLKDAVDFLRAEGVRVETGLVPPELHPGIDYAAYAFDPDGHCLELYYYMEQVGWDGRVRPAAMRRPVDPHYWPATLEPLSDTFTGEPFLGPWA